MKILKAKERYENPLLGRGFHEPASAKSGKKIVYPDSDGKPMADNTKQYEWIVKIKENLERMFQDNPDVFIGGDLLWYPVDGNNKIRAAPDAMVAFGRPKGDRGSYQTWKENHIAPQVVFEILSPSNKRAEMERKFQFYQQYGVEEYYIYDPDRFRLNGWIRTGEYLSPIPDMHGWTSPLLKIRFELASDNLVIYCPDGTPFLTTLELDRIAKENRRRAEAERKKAELAARREAAALRSAEAERKKAELAAQKEAAALRSAEAERKKAETERKRAELAAQKETAALRSAEAERKKAETERKEKERLAALLRELGVEI